MSDPGPDTLTTNPNLVVVAEGRARLCTWASAPCRCACAQRQWQPSPRTDAHPHTHCIQNHTLPHPDTQVLLQSLPAHMCVRGREGGGTEGGTERGRIGSHNKR
jgi:hypothetical protein